MTLEQRIKLILEGKADGTTLSEKDIKDLQEKEVIKTKGGTTIEDDGDDKSDDKEDDTSDDVEKDEDGEEGKEDGDTDVSKDQGPSPKKDKVDVAEDFNVATPGQGKKIPTQDPNAGANGAAKTSKIKAKQSNRDDADEAGGPKLKNGAKADAQDDNGDNARITSKQKAGREAAPTESDGATKVEGDSDINGFGKTDQIFGVKEHMEALFNGETLSEEFKTKATTIFEAAVEQAAQVKFEQLQETYQQQLDEAVEEVKSELQEQIDGYLDYVVEQWVADNAVALESGIKSEVVESFIDGLKVLFKEHYVDIPEDAVNVVEEQASKLEEQETTIAELNGQIKKLAEETVSVKRKVKIAEVAGSLTATQKDKFEGLVEKVEYTSDEEFVAKIKTIKESYFPVGKPESAIPKNDDSTQQIVESTNKSVESYVKALGGNLKFSR